MSIALAHAPVLAPPPALPPVALRLEGVSRRHGVGADAVVALDTLSLSVRAGEFVCVVGASGCGKSTMLNLVAGLDTPTAGQVHVAGGRPALMFQESALFPWLTVEENVAFPLEMQGVARGERRRRVAELLAMVHLESFARRRPHELSGGMKQRVALARALAQRANLLLMDEPFAALDAMMRDHLHCELESLWQQTGLTVVFVTHNVREAVRLGDRVLLLSSRPGRLVAEYAIDIPRPRRIESPEVARSAREITDRLHEAVRDA
ncbi:ABC transporter ATP-binding protein [Nannocystis sp.]|uniref:ABC transporter ATP-binding protein n=1 Tax=Nannocystis sp. TaxID=1962667 RepID=UPI0024278F42|nr:ABC transporter ATP-binding protein [Nannocystis sp.]MBK7830124.1 ABC transporter ATP-binding protein [Nannocystis sp.]MBK9752104.1 ABC transporter ATP-binding protein [Nannocystis sp.]